MEKFQGKWILIDTNPLIEVSKHLDDHLFDDFLKELEDLDIHSAISSSILFEY